MDFKFKGDNRLYITSMNSFKTSFKYPLLTTIHHWPIGIPLDKTTTTISLRTWTNESVEKHYSIELSKIKNEKLIKKLGTWEGTIDMKQLKNNNNEIRFTLPL